MQNYEFNVTHLSNGTENEADGDTVVVAATGSLTLVSQAANDAKDSLMGAPEAEFSVLLSQADRTLLSMTSDGPIVHDVLATRLRRERKAVKDAAAAADPAPSTESASE